MTATVVEEKQLLLITMAASQATEVRAVTTEKRKRGEKERRVPSVASGLNLLTVGGVLDDAAAMAGAYSRTQRRHSACIGPFRFWVNERKSNVYGSKMGKSLVREGENEGMCLKKERSEAYGGESRSVSGSPFLLWQQKQKNEREEFYSI
ncbi:hypothetical protein NC651_007261 [Populus alba x Populus x berolinensis]|nr:hypothetical protein NC651_007261 [Populus alba x Populus x berolinensis]